MCGLVTSKDTVIGLAQDLGVEVRPGAIVERGDALRVLDQLWDAALRQSAVGLLSQIRETEVAVREEHLAHRDMLMESTRAAFRMLRSASDTAAVYQYAAPAVSDMGFDRALVSKIENSVWVPETMSFPRSPDWGTEIVQAGRSVPSVLDGVLIETEVMRRGASLLVDDVQHNPRVHRDIARVSRSRDYAVAPVTVGSTVVAMLHVDCFYQQRKVQPEERQALSMVADCMGQSLARTLVMDELTAVRGAVQRMSDTFGAPAKSVPTLPAPAEDCGGCGLTAREADVLRLLTVGDTNAQIARRLYISEGTVKSHVKQILHKLGAANRAEAVSRWLHYEHAAGRCISHTG